MRINFKNFSAVEDEIESLPSFQPRKEIKYSQRTKKDEEKRKKKGRKDDE